METGWHMWEDKQCHRLSTPGHWYKLTTEELGEGRREEEREGGEMEKGEVIKERLYMHVAPKHSYTVHTHTCTCMLRMDNYICISYVHVPNRIIKRNYSFSTLHDDSILIVKCSASNFARFLGKQKNCIQ